MKDLFHQFIPFMILSTGNGGFKIDWSRIIEALIVAAVGGTLAGYLAVQKLQLQFGHLRESVNKIEKNVEKNTDLIIEHMIVREKK